jgi:hypothetical protein
MGAYSASFAIVKVCNEVIVLRLINSHIRTEQIADPALNTVILVDNRTHGPPVTRLVRTGVAGVADNAPYFQIFPGEFLF